MPRQNELNTIRALKAFWDENAHKLHTDERDIPLGIQREIGRILAKEIRRVQEHPTLLPVSLRIEPGVN
jgi:hypothetical protein